jgi:NAD(P)-dependent dehydrogenase (short-subunit alcohol dehydrogenase family)
LLLEDRVAIITGGAVGIGRGIAVKFAAEGCSVVVADVADSEGEKTAKMVSELGRKGIYIHCDVTDNNQVQAMVDTTVKELGKIDILVNSAGGVIGGGSGAIESATEEGWDWILNLNLKSQFLCCRAVVPHMKRNNYGKIINISSMGAISPPAPIVHYHAAKGGIISLTSNLACELARSNITVNAILPGPIRSEFYQEILNNVPDEKAFFETLGKRVPMQRIGTPEDIAGVAVFLASDLSSFVTGESICAGGGLPMTPE